MIIIKVKPEASLRRFVDGVEVSALPIFLPYHPDKKQPSDLNYYYLNNFGVTLSLETSFDNIWNIGDFINSQKTSSTIR